MTQKEPLWLYLCVQMVHSCLPCLSSKVELQKESFQSFCLAVLLPGKYMNAWDGNVWIGWEYSQTLHWSGIQKCCSTACAGFLPLTHDDVGGGGYPTSLVDALLFASLLMSELTRHWWHLFPKIGKIGCWIQASMYMWLHLLHDNWLSKGNQGMW